VKRVVMGTVAGLVVGVTALVGAGTAAADRPYYWDGPYDSLSECDTTRLNDPAANGTCSYRSVSGVLGWYYPALYPY